MYNLLKKRSENLAEDKKKSPFPAKAPAKLPFEDDSADLGPEAQEGAPADGLSHEGLAAHYQSLADHHKAQADKGAPSPTPGDLSEYGDDDGLASAETPDPVDLDIQKLLEDEEAEDKGGKGPEDEAAMSPESEAEETPEDEAAESPMIEKAEKAKGLDLEEKPAVSNFSKFRKGKR